MKKTTLLLVLAFIFSLSTFAGHHSGRSTLKLKLWNHERFSVEIDHQIFSAEVRDFKIDNLQPGEHFIKVIKKTRRYNGFITQVVFRGKIYVKAASVITAKITRNHQFDILSVRPKGQVNHNAGQHGQNGHNSHGGSQGVNSHGSNGNTGVNSHNTSVGYEYIDVMSEYSFEMLKETMISLSFDSKRLEIAKSAISGNFLFSEQVLELMELLTFESHRLELAKFAYTSTVDRENYFVVHKAFVFGSSIAALNHYIYTMPV